MKLTKEKLKQIVKEELAEMQQINPTTSGYVYTKEQEQIIALRAGLNDTVRILKNLVFEISDNVIASQNIPNEIKKAIAKAQEALKTANK